MRKLILAVAMVGAGLTSNVNAQSNCDATEVIDEYERAKVEEIPPLDMLTEAEKTAAIALYERIVGIIDEQIVIESGEAMPKLRPDLAVSKLELGGEDMVDGTIALHVNLLLSAMPSDEWLTFRNRFAASIPALKGESSETFGQVQDRINREAMEAVLRYAGCPDDLYQDHGVTPYTPQLPNSRMKK